jgi:hypothetical protein
LQYVDLKIVTYSVYDMCNVALRKERIKSQRNIILEELARTDDKKHATQRILESIFSLTFYTLFRLIYFAH